MAIYANLEEMRTDPSDTGGLFLGRRPGTGPIHFRMLPQRGGDVRQHIDGSLACVLLGAMVLISLLCWGPIPLVCLWIGSQVDYVSGSVFLGIVMAFIALFPLLFGALAILHQVDRGWLLVRRAAGHDQRTGTMVRVFAYTTLICAAAFLFWLLVINGPGSTVMSGPAHRAASLSP